MEKIKLSENTIQFLEDWHTPVRLLECLFNDFDNWTSFKKGKFGYVRFYQYSMLSDEPLIDFELTAEQEQMIINSIQSIETELQTD
jgi:hypothetical protein